MDYFLNAFFITLGITSAVGGVLIVLALIGTAMEYIKKLRS